MFIRSIENIESLGTIESIEYRYYREYRDYRDYRDILTKWGRSNVTSKGLVITDHKFRYKIRIINLHQTVA